MIPALQPLTEDPRERSFSGRVGGLLWIGGGCTFLAQGIVHPTGTPHLPLALTLAVGVAALVWGALSSWVLDWVNGPGWLGHMTAGVGLATLTTMVYLSGAQSSIGWGYFAWLALFGAFFFRRRPAVVFMLACLTGQALPLAVHPVRALDDGAVWRLALVIFGYASVGAAVIRGKHFVLDLRRSAERVADVDPLTGLFNHRRMGRALSEHAARALDTGAVFALALLDIDHFIHIRELGGQAEVEHVLRGLAAATARQAGPEDVVARTGSDAFTWLMPGLTAREARARVESVRPLVGLDAAHPVQFSAAIIDSTVTLDLPTLDRLLEGALFWSKAEGPAQSRIYDPEVMDMLSAEERGEQLRRAQALIGLQALARAIDAKDPATRQHSERVAVLAEALARIVGWKEARALALRDAALVHDVGKIGVNDAVLHKAGPLTPAEREHINSHAAMSARIVDGALSPEQVDWIASHHERVDGLGYPRGLRGEEIPLGGALLAVADAYDAITAGRPYSAPREPAEALNECRAQAGRHFSHEAVAALEVWLLTGGAANGTRLPSPPKPAGSLVSAHGPGREH